MRLLAPARRSPRHPVPQAHEPTVPPPRPPPISTQQVEMVAAVAPEPDSPDHVRTVKTLRVDDDQPKAAHSAMSPTFVDNIDLSSAQHAMMYAAILIPIAAFLGIYSAMGEGVAVYGSLSEDGNYEVAWYLCVAAVVWLALMWVVDAFDKSITSPNVKKAVYVMTAIPLAMMFVASLLAVEEYISAPMVLFVVFKCLMEKMLYDTAFPYVAIGKFMLANGYANLVASLITIVSWLVWMWGFDKQWSNTEMFALYHGRLDCNRATDSLEEARCQAAYLLWGSPLILGMLCFFFGIACMYLARDGSAVRMIIVQFLILGMGMWVSVSISGAEMGLADDILQFALLFCSMMLVVCVNMVGYDNLREKLGSMRITQKLGEYSQSNFAKGMVIALTLPILPAFLLLSACIRQARIFGLSMASTKRDADAEFNYFTAAGWGMLKWLFSDVTAVFTWTAYIAMFYFICDVGVGKGAVLFLGWMISIMKDYSPAVVLVCFVLLGVGMFLLPPVPGPPVYLTGGVLLVGSMEDSMGFWGATLACVFVCWFVKLVSCTLQQKWFGESLGGYVGVRYTVGINSVQMRAIRYCLMQPGLSPAKVAILCGGPDWPTSVLCGILRVPLYESVLGTSPVLVLYLAYTVLAGAFMLKTGGSCASDGAATAADAALSPSPPPPPFPPPAEYAEVGSTNYWEMASAVALGVAMVSMSCTSFAAVYFMENTIENKKAECEAFPVDEEVEAREIKVQAKQVAYKHVTRWGNLPALDRALLGGAVACMTAACHLAGNFGSRCFATFTVTCTVALVDVVKTLGWVAISLFAFGLILFQLYQRGAKQRTRSVMESNSQKANDMIAESPK
jgi:hypothetical protein